MKFKRISADSSGSLSRSPRMHRGADREAGQELGAQALTSQSSQPSHPQGDHFLLPLRDGDDHVGDELALGVVVSIAIRGRRWTSPPARPFESAPAKSNRDLLSLSNLDTTSTSPAEIPSRAGPSSGRSSTGVPPYALVRDERAISGPSPCLCVSPVRLDCQAVGLLVRRDARVQDRSVPSSGLKPPLVELGTNPEWSLTRALCQGKSKVTGSIF